MPKHYAEQIPWWVKFLPLHLAAWILNFNEQRQCFHNYYISTLSSMDYSIGDVVEHVTSCEKVACYRVTDNCCLIFDNTDDLKQQRMEHLNKAYELKRIIDTRLH